MVNKTILAAVLTSLLFIPYMYPQVHESWVSRYNGTGNSIDIPYSVLSDGNGFVYVTGFAGGTSSDDDYCTIKYNSSGVQEWAVTYNGPGNSNDRAYAMLLDENGNVYITGESTGNGTSADFCTIKYNSFGVQQWIARYNAPGNRSDRAVSLARDVNGNTFVIGESQLGMDCDFCTIKYSTNGVQLWVKTYNAPYGGMDIARKILIRGNNEIYVCGVTSTNYDEYDLCLIKYNALGNQQWIRKYHGPTSQGFYFGGAALDPDGSIIISGNNDITGITTIKYTPAGDSVWIRTYKRNIYSCITASRRNVTDANGSIYITGYTCGPTLDRDYCTLKYNSSGAIEWVRTYGTEYGLEDEPTGMAIDDSANIYVTGMVSEPAYSDFCTIKYTSSGILQWARKFSNKFILWDMASAIALDENRSVYVTGTSWANASLGDIVTIKYSQLIGIKPASGKIPSAFKLHQNYPNPFNPVTSIRIDIPLAAHTGLTVLDALGKTVAVLVDKELKPGSYDLSWDGSNFSSGIYFVKLTSGTFSSTKKMILLK